MLASQSSRHPFLSASSAPSVVFSSLLWDRQGLSGFSFVRNCDPEFFVANAHVQSLKNVFTVFSRYECTLSICMGTLSFFVSVFSIRLRLRGSSANMAVGFSVDDFVVSRFFTEVLSCVSVRFFSFSELKAPGVIVVSDSSPCISWSSSSAGFTEGSSSLCVKHVWTGSGRAGKSVARGISGVVDFSFCGVSTFARRVLF